MHFEECCQLAIFTPGRQRKDNLYWQIVFVMNILADFI
jgi:hypothetical protein